MKLCQSLLTQEDPSNIKTLPCRSLWLRIAGVTKEVVTMANKLCSWKSPFAAPSCGRCSKEFPDESRRSHRSEEPATALVPQTFTTSPTRSRELPGIQGRPQSMWKVIGGQGRPWAGGPGVYNKTSWVNKTEILSLWLLQFLPQVPLMVGCDV